MVDEEWVAGSDKPFPAGAVVTQFTMSSPTEAVLSTFENKSSTRNAHTLRSSAPRFIRMSSFSRVLMRALLGWPGAVACNEREDGG